MIEKYMRESLKSFQAYVPEPDIYDIKLDANENPYNHSDEFLQELKETITSELLTRYPDTNSVDLVTEIANYWKVDTTQVICGVGSDQIIDATTKLLLNPGDIGLVPTPSFSMYKHSICLNHGEAIEYSLTNDYNYDIESMIETCKLVKPKFMIICTPNNPTGNIITNEQLEKVLSHVECPVIVDEAYAEFTDETAIDLISKFDNLIILRTFSKSYGLAGARVGYAVSSKEIIDAIRLCIPPYSLSTFTQIVAKNSIQGKESYRKYIKMLKSSKDKLYNILCEKNQIEKVYPSYANFLLVKFKNKNVSNKLKEESVLVRDFSNHPLLTNCLRVTIGTETEINRLLDAIDKL
jgi:histidinol-phosphate aminotransferase